jgi:hypothetical protein
MTPSPFRKYVRLPAMRAARSLSTMSSDSASSWCERGVKPNSRMVPQRRSSTFSVFRDVRRRRHGHQEQQRAPFRFDGVVLDAQLPIPRRDLSHAGNLPLPLLRRQRRDLAAHPVLLGRDVLDLPLQHPPAVVGAEHLVDVHVESLQPGALLHLVTVLCYPADVQHRSSSRSGRRRAANISAAPAASHAEGGVIFRS